MPQYSKEIQGQIAREAQEAGIGGYKSPVGLHHVVFGDVKVLEGADGTPRLQLGTKVVCGPFQGREIVIFQGYFARETTEKDPGGETYKARQLQSAQIFKGLFNGLRESKGELMEELRDGVFGLPNEFEFGDAKATEEVRVVMRWLAEYLPGIDGYLKVSDKKNSDYQSFRFAKAQDTTCECE